MVLLAGPALAQKPVEANRRQTIGGAYDRARVRLDLFNRQLEFDRQNQGPNGRKNATRDEQRQMEVGPWLQPKPLSGW